MLLCKVSKRSLMENAVKWSRGGAFLPELCISCCLRYHAGGSYSTGIKFFIGISLSVFIALCGDVLMPSTDVPYWQMDFPRTNDDVIWAAKDSAHELHGCHRWISSPNQTTIEVRGQQYQIISCGHHYQMYGLIILAMCDHNCWFLFIVVASPGVIWDCNTIK